MGILIGHRQSTRASWFAMKGMHRVKKVLVDGGTD
jgi:hypothetical protein